jgi:hypothetical protein
MLTPSPFAATLARHSVVAAACLAFNCNIGAVHAATAITSDAPARLLALCEGRRPSQWTAAERPALDTLVDEVANLHAPVDANVLRGKWRLAYIQPGIAGAIVDRRIPFPELPFNENYQIFGESTVTNVGQLLGSALEVRVSGSLSEDDPADLIAPKRFRAQITQGGLCFGGGDACLSLPVFDSRTFEFGLRTTGIFDAVYLDSRVRIGQSLNGGGARSVQVRVE